VLFDGVCSNLRCCLACFLQLFFASLTRFARFFRWCSCAQVHGHGGAGPHASFTVESCRGHLQFKNDSGSYLACQDGELKKGGGGKWCDFAVKDKDGHLVIRSVHGNWGVGFETNGEAKPADKTGEGQFGQFAIHRL
jgi:hypothetical protein